jgi:WD40 repeat protein
LRTGSGSGKLAIPAAELAVTLPALTLLLALASAATDAGRTSPPHADEVSPLEVIVGRTHDDAVTGIAVHPAGHLVATAGGSRVLVWDRAALTPVKELRVDGSAKAVAFGPDGTVVALVRGLDGQSFAVRWAFPTGEIRSMVPGGDGWKPAIAADGSAAALLASYDGKVLVLGEQPRTTALRMASGTFDVVAVSAGGSLLAVGGVDGKIKLVSPLEPGTPSRTVEVGSPVGALAFSFDGTKLAVGSRDGSVRVFAPTDPGSAPRVLAEPLSAASDDDRIVALAFGAGDELAVATKPRVRIFRPGSEPRVIEHRFLGPIALAPDELIAISAFSELHAYSRATGAERPWSGGPYFDAPAQPVWLGFDRSGALDVRADGVIGESKRSWDAHGVRDLGSPAQHGVLFSRRGVTWIVDERLWARPLRQPEDPLRRPDPIAGLPDGQAAEILVLQGGDLALARIGDRWWTVDLAARRLGKLAPLRHGDSTYVATQSDGPLVAYADGTRKVTEIWDASTGARRAILAEHGAVVVASRGSLVAIQTMDFIHPTVSIWDASRGTRIASIEAAGPICFSPDGRSAAIASARGVLLWSASEPTRTRAVALERPVRLLSWSPRGDLLVVGPLAGPLAAVDPASAAVRWTVSGPPGAVNAIAWHPARPLLAAAYRAGSIALVDGGGERLATLAAWYGRSDRADDGVLAWMAFAPDGRFEANPEGLRFVSFVRRGVPFAAPELSALHAPGLLARALGDTAPLAPGPVAVRITWPAAPLTTSAAEVPVSLEVAPGVTRYELAVNGAAIVREVGERREERVTRTFTLRLAAGENFVRAIPYDLAGAPGATAELRITRTTSDPPADTPELVPQVGHLWAPHAAALDQTGRRLATAAADRTVRIWDVRAGMLLQVLAGLPLEPEAVGFSPDGDRVAVRGAEGTQSAGDRREALAIFDVATGRLQRVEIGRVDAPEAAWIPAATKEVDPRREARAGGLAVVLRSEAKLIDSSGKTLVVLPGESGVPAFSGDGSVFAFAERDRIDVFDAPTGRRVRRISAQAVLPDGIAFEGSDALVLRHKHRLLRLSFETASLEVFREDDTRSPFSQAPDGWSGLDVAKGGTVALGRFGSLVLLPPERNAGPSLRPVAPGAYPVALHFSPDERKVAAIVQHVRGPEEDRGKKEVALFPRGAAKNPVLERAAVPAHHLVFTEGGRRLVAAGWAPPEVDLPSLYNPGLGHDIWPAHSAKDARPRLWAWDVATGRRTDHDLGTCIPRSLAGRPRGSGLVAGCEDGRVLAFGRDLDHAGAARPLHRGAVLAAAFSPAGDVLATGGLDGIVFLLDPVTLEVRRALLGHGAPVVTATWSSDGARLVTEGYDGTLRLWSAATGEEIARFVLGAGEDLVVALPGGHYSGTKGATVAAGFRAAGRVVPFDLFDVARNRPDQVLEALGSRDARLHEAVTAAVKRRLRGARPASPGQRPPRVELVRSRPDGARVALTVRALPGDAPLRALRVRANDVPLADVPIAPGGGETAIPVELEPGRNLLRVAAVDAAAAESLPEITEVSGPPSGERPRLFLLAIGVSRYSQGGLDLRWAHIDALRLAERWKGAGAFSGVETHVLTDGEATRDAVLRAGAFLARTRPGDLAVVFVAGHGVADRGRYFFAPHDMDFDRPDERGLGPDDLEGLFAGIPARRRLLLLDTCHAGPIDDEPVAQLAQGVTREAGARAIRSSGERASTSFETMRGLFADLSRGSGAVVLAAASGDQYAYEREGGGVFTSAVLEALAGGAADRDGDGAVSVVELQSSVAERVKALTGGAQAPTFRRDTISRNFEVARSSALLAEVATEAFVALGIDARAGAIVGQSGATMLARYAVADLAPLEPFVSAAPLERMAWRDEVNGISPDGAFELRPSSRAGIAIVSRRDGKLLRDVPGVFAPRGFQPSQWSATWVLLDELGKPGDKTTLLVPLDPAVAPTRLPDLKGAFDHTFLPDGSAVVGQLDRELVVAYVDGHRAQHIPLVSRGERVLDVAIAPEGERVVAAVDGAGGAEALATYDLRTGGRIRTVPLARKGASSVAIDPRGLRAALLYPGEVIDVVDVDTARPVASVRVAPGTTPTVFFTPDGHRIVVSTPTRLQLWDVAGAEMDDILPTR